MWNIFKKKLRCKLLGKHIEIRNSKVDKYTSIGDGCTITKAQIGRYVSIGNNVTIGSGEYDLSILSTSAWFYDDPLDVLCKKDCIIGNDVWIGVDSIIRRGVKIGNGAVIGANSFVNKDVSDFAIVAGNPAKIIRYRFEPDLQKEITASDWWNKNLDEAKQILLKLKNG